MKKQEANRLLLWLLAAFPQWKVDAATTAVWADELPDVPAEAVQAVIRSMMRRYPSPFPPGVFEVAGEMSEANRPEIDAKIIFAHLWDQGHSTPEAAEMASSRVALDAVRLCGGGYGQALTKDRDWHEKRFVEVYCGLLHKQDAKEHVTTLKLHEAKAARQLGQGESRGVKDFRDGKGMQAIGEIDLIKKARQS